VLDDVRRNQAGSVQKRVAREEKCEKEEKGDEQTPSCTKAMRSKEDLVGHERGRDICGFGSAFGQGGLVRTIRLHFRENIRATTSIVHSLAVREAPAILNTSGARHRSVRR
jgi:hypothetical protein